MKKTIKITKQDLEIMVLEEIASMLGRELNSAIITEAKKVPKSSDVANYNQHKIALDTVKHPNKGFMGGPSADESIKILKTKFGYTDADIKKIK